LQGTAETDFRLSLSIFQALNSTPLNKAEKELITSIYIVLITDRSYTKKSDTLFMAHSVYFNLMQTFTSTKCPLK